VLCRGEQCRSVRRRQGHAIDAGWGQYDELKVPDFEAVRGRDGYLKLLAELAARTKKP
jgi:hypothetical protein